MTFYKVLKNLSKHISLSQDEEEQFTKLLQIRTLKRGEPVLQEGQPCQYIYFVNAGILRAYHLTPQGKESSLMFAMPD